MGQSLGSLISIWNYPKGVTMPIHQAEMWQFPLRLLRPLTRDSTETYNDE